MSSDLEARRVYHRQYYLANRERLLAQAKVYRHKHSEEIKTKAQTFREQNRDKLCDRHKQYYQENHGQIKERAAHVRNNNRKSLSERAKVYYHANRDSIRSRARMKRQKHHEESLEREKIYREKNNDKIKKQFNEYRTAHKDKVKKWSKNYYKKNTKKIKERIAIYRRSHPEIDKVHRKRRRALKAGADINDFSHAQWLEIQAMQDHRCYYCAKRRKGQLTEDHVVPLSKGGDHTQSNIVAACQSCNSEKWANPPPIPVQLRLFTLAAPKPSRGS